VGHTKLVAYGQSAILTPGAIASGIPLGLVMAVGAFAGKRLMSRIPETGFVFLVKVTLIVVGLVFLLRDTK